MFCGKEAQPFNLVVMESLPPSFASMFSRWLIEARRRRHGDPR